MAYAQDTSVSVEKTKAEIETTLMRHGATGFVTGWQGNQAMIAFEMRDRRIKFMLPLPDRKDKRFQFTPSRQWQRTPEEALKAWEQECRSAWRALGLAIKAKLEAIERKITTFEEEFMAHIVLPTGMTIGETILPRLNETLSGNPLPPLLPGPAN